MVTRSTFGAPGGPGEGPLAGAAAGLIGWEDFAEAALRHWVGDLIGIAVVTPFLLIILTRGRPLRFGAETILQGIAKRVEAGTASSAQAKASGDTARPMAQLAWSFAQRG